MSSSVVECTESYVVNEVLEKRPKLPTSIDVDDLVDIVARRIAIPLAEGAYQAALHQLRSIYLDIHGDDARNPLEDHISVWIKNPKLCSILEEVGVVTMHDLMAKQPVWYMQYKMIKETEMRRIADAQRRCRDCLDEISSCSS